MSDGAKQKSRAASIFAFFFGLSLLVAVAGLSFYFLVDKTVISPAQKFANLLGDLTDSKVAVEGTSVVYSTEEIAELAVVERRTQAIVKYTSSFMGSEKILILQQGFRVKAGFKLKGDWSWEISEQGVIAGEWPKAQVLSVEPDGQLTVFFAENGLINKLSPSDHTRAVNELIATARMDARKGGIREEADRILQQRFKDVIGQEAILP